MAKIDLEKLICSLAKRKYFSEEKLQDALKEQGFEYKDGEIVEVQKPKFKVGDWVVDNHGKVNQVTSVTDDSYGFTLYDGTYVSGCWKDYYHLWTIQDAKDGDVLYSLDSKQSFIFKHRKPNEQAEVYCGINIYGKFFVGNTKDCIITTDKYIPATNAQRAILFQKMKEAGWEWNAEKKEAKKIDNRFDYEHANIQQKDFAPKATAANRQLYNRAILKLLSDYIEKYPDIRFGQMLCNLDVNPHFDEESRETYCNLNENINKKS